LSPLGNRAASVAVVAFIVTRLQSAGFESKMDFFFGGGGGGGGGVLKSLPSLADETHLINIQ